VQRKHQQSPEQWRAVVDRLKSSVEVYVGNLSFFTTEDQIHKLFSSVGPVKKVIMGLNKITKTPCGFCFVVYFHHADAVAATKYISGTKVRQKI
jgi:nuclear cap-binding protein subunit 2